MAAFYGADQERQYFGWKDAANVSAAELAIKLVQRFPELCKRTRGKDEAYIRWYEKTLPLIGDDAVPVMQGNDSYDQFDERCDLVVVTTAGDLFVPAPPGGLDGNSIRKPTPMSVPLSVTDGGWIQGSDGHSAYLPYIHRALSNWGDTQNSLLGAPCLHPLPKPPRTSAVQASTAYWEGALYWMAYLFGWSRPVADVHQLLQRLESDTVPDDLLLATFLRVWNNHGQLDLLARWLYECNEPQQGLWPHRRYSRLPQQVSSVTPSPEWLHRFSTKRWPESYCRFPSPRYDGNNPLHLGATFVADYEPSEPPRITAKPDGHFATFVLKDLNGWYSTLCEYSQELGKSLRAAQLFSETHGQIATMRRSYDIGLWFACRHEVHQWGH